LNKIIGMHSIEHYMSEFISYLNSNTETKEPKNLYEPISYILGLGGKRLRPVLVLMATEIFDTDYKKALDAALAIEVFHNFSLVHDDIMDDAPVRRGKTTVHEKWDINTGILSGDAMLISAYQLFENYEGRDDVTQAEYLKMIEFKTAVLVAAALKMGGIVAGASTEDQDSIYEFGRNLGIAFQLQDDYLDAFGDPKTFGKQVGGDIIENKKTYLYLKALEKGTAQQQKELRDLFSIHPEDATEKIETIKNIFEQSGSSKETQIAIEAYTKKAFSILEPLTISEDKKNLLRAFGENLMKRTV